MTTESWRQDWVECGGMQNGNYSSDAVSGSTTAVLIAEDKATRNKLDACMQSKDYQFSYTGTGGTK